MAFWFMEDARYAAAIDRARRRGVRVRVLMDPRANPTYPNNATVLNQIQGYGVPMRKRLTSYILHWKMMLFRVRAWLSSAVPTTARMRFDMTRRPDPTSITQMSRSTSPAIRRSSTASGKVR